MSSKYRRWLFALVALLVVAGGAFYVYRWMNPSKPIIEKPNVGPTRSREPIAVPKVPFKNVAKEAGIDFTHFQGLSGKKLLPETMGSGVAFLDFNNDDHQDLLFVNSGYWPGAEEKGPLPTPKLYRNKGDGTFEDVTAKMGLNVTMYGLGVTVGDYDNDDFVDIFISCAGKHRLFHNEKGERFREVTDEAGVGGNGKLPSVSRAAFLEWKDPIPFGASCTFLDYDGDGRLDLFVCHYVTWSPVIDMSIKSTLKGGKRSYVQPTDFDGSFCRLYRNVDGKRFEDVTESSGVAVVDRDGISETARRRPVGKSLGVIVTDADGDGWPDIMVANDSVRNFFFHNVAGPKGTRIFKEIGQDIGAAWAVDGQPRGGMGIDCAEYRPAKFAVVITNFTNEANTFLALETRKPLQFSDYAQSACLAGPSRGPLKFGAVFFDFDLDGRLDLLTANGHIEPEIADIQNGQTHAQPAQLFWNTNDAERIFEPVTAGDSGKDLFEPMVGRGLAYADIDKDGDLDVVITANGGPAQLFRNEYTSKHKNRWVRLLLKGDGKRSNTCAIGAEVKIEAGDLVLHRQITAGRGYLSQSELPLTVGLGKGAKVDRVTITWPGKDHLKEVWTDLEVGKTHTLKQGSAAK